MATRITIGTLSFDIEAEPHQKFWNKLARGDWEPETYAIFDRHITAKTLFLDVGAWIGSTTLYGAQKAAKCVSFEPDPVAFAELSRNVAQNATMPWVKRLKIEECAVNGDGASFTLGGSAEGANSMSSALFPDRDSQWTVRATTLPEVLKKHRKAKQPVFVKIDIEGGEYYLVPAIKDLLADPLLTAYISFHPMMLRQSVANPANPEAGEKAYIDRHLAVIDALPWDRPITLSDGAAVERVRLERWLTNRGQFPRELVVGTP